MSLNEAKKTVSRLEKSFFDVPNPSAMFWKQIDASDFSNYSRSLENEFYVRSSKYFQTWDNCSLSVQNNFLVVRKKKTAKTVEYIDLDEHMYKIKVIYPDDSRTSVKYKHGFSVSANGQSFEFYCKEKSQLNKWLMYFRKTCVMADFHENYTTLETIGKGGYGEVRLLQDNATKSKRAGKFITIADGNDKKFSKQRIMILNEIKILRKTDHPNIVKMYEIYEVGNEICLIMEYIEGIHLLKYLTKEKRLTEKETATIMKQLLLVLNYLASMDIIHRDVKSENIMLFRTKEGKLNIKLIDFGLSTLLYQRDAIKRCGTPGYVAPEILHGDTYDCRVDLYSSGIIMFACLTGKPPFSAENYDELLEKNKKGIIVYKGKNWMQISSEGKNMIQRLLEPVSSRLTLEEALCHNWLQEYLSAEEKKHLTEYRFHIVKMNVPEETRISSVPINSTQVSHKSALNLDNNHPNRYTSLNSFYLSKTQLSDPANRLNSFYKPSITRDLGGDDSPTSLTKVKPQLLGGMQTLDIYGMKNNHNLLDLSSTITPSYRDNSEMLRSKGDVRDKEDISIMKFHVQRLSVDHSFEELIPDDRPTCGDRYQELAELTHCFSKLKREPAGYCLKSDMQSG